MKGSPPARSPTETVKVENLREEIASTRTQLAKPEGKHPGDAQRDVDESKGKKRPSGNGRRREFPGVPASRTS